MLSLDNVLEDTANTAVGAGRGHGCRRRRRDDIETVMTSEIDSNSERNSRSSLLRRAAEVAPAMGLIDFGRVDPNALQS